VRSDLHEDGTIGAVRFAGVSMQNPTFLWRFPPALKEEEQAAAVRERLNLLNLLSARLSPPRRAKTKLLGYVSAFCKMHETRHVSCVIGACSVRVSASSHSDVVK
jgi:hypothetical protein